MKLHNLLANFTVIYEENFEGSEPSYSVTTKTNLLMTHQREADTTQRFTVTDVLQLQ